MQSLGNSGSLLKEMYSMEKGTPVRRSMFVERSAAYRKNPGQLNPKTVERMLHGTNLKKVQGFHELP